MRGMYGGKQEGDAAVPLSSPVEEQAPILLQVTASRKATWTKSRLLTLP